MSKYLSKIMRTIISLIFVLVVWKMLIFLFDYPAYILPSPELVWQKLISLFVSGKIYPHLQTTLVEILVGFMFGGVFALLVGYLFAKIKVLHITITPYIVAFQSIPIVALAPLFIIWFGPGITSKIIICAIIVFFPVMINTIAAITNIGETKKELMRTFNASFWDYLFKLEIPHTLPYIFSSAKIGIVMAVVGAIVGEFIGADKGLGFLINSSLGLFDIPQLFAVIFVLAFLGIFFYSFSSFLESLFIKKVGKNEN